MGIKFANFVDTTIADLAGVSAIATEFTVNAGDGALFPTLGVGDHCVIVCVTAAGTREIMHVTAVSTDTLTVVREQEGTTGLVFAQDDIVQGRVTAGSLELLDDLDGVTASATEINTACDGILATAAEINAVCDGASSGSGAAGGDLTGNVYWEKIGNIVFITWATLTHASSHFAVTAAGLIPAAFRPASNHYDTVYVNQLGSLSIIVSTLGTFNFYYHDSAGAIRNATQVLAGSTHYRAA